MRKTAKPIFWVRMTLVVEQFTCFINSKFIENVHIMINISIQHRLRCCYTFKLSDVSSTRKGISPVLKKCFNDSMLTIICMQASNTSTEDSLMMHESKQLEDKLI